MSKDVEGLSLKVNVQNWPRKRTSWKIQVALVGYLEDGKAMLRAAVQEGDRPTRRP